jgi:hypothetical protein
MPAGGPEQEPVTDHGPYPVAWNTITSLKFVPSTW